MPKADFPVTPAVRRLRELQLPFEPQLYPYLQHGGTAHAAASLGVPEHQVIKTLILETDGRHPLIVLMHGDCEVSTKNLARHLGVRQVTPCEAATAERLTGYTVGGISPFGTRRSMPVYAERTILALPRIYINGGKRGFLLAIDPAVLRQALSIEEVEVATGQ